jgi:insertion element IS1 protein InsB
MREDTGIRTRPHTSTLSHLLHQAWIWIALGRKTRQVISYAIGDRSDKTCRQLWEAIPEMYRAGHCFTDFWVVYRAFILEEQHIAVGRETGETVHVERWNNTLWQRLARFVRKHFPSQSP